MSAFLREQRLRRDLSARDVAAQLAVHPMSVHRWERRERLPGPAHLTRLAEILDLEVVVLADYFDEKRDERPVEALGLRGQGLRPLRRSASVPVARISRSLGVPPSTIYNWEAGRVRIPRHHLDGLAGLLGVRPGALEAALLRAPLERPDAGSVSGLRRLRRRTGLSQDQTARLIGTGRHRLGAWERGRRPPLVAVRRLASVYGVPVADVARAAGVAAPLLLHRPRWAPGDLPGVLRVLREWNGLSRRELAERCGCSASSVRGWECGRTLPSPRMRARVEHAYGLPAGALLTAYPQ